MKALIQSIIRWWAAMPEGDKFMYLSGFLLIAYLGCIFWALGWLSNQE